MEVTGSCSGTGAGASTSNGIPVPPPPDILDQQLQNDDQKPCTSTSSQNINTMTSMTSDPFGSTPSTATTSNQDQNQQTDDQGQDQSANNYLIDDQDSEQRLPIEVRLKYNSERWRSDHPLIDVLFVFDGVKLGAHKFILLDAPVSDFFPVELIQKSKRGQIAVLDVPSGITVEAVDRLLSYIYGRGIRELEITDDNLGEFLDAATYMKIDVQLLPQLLTIQNQEFKNLELFITSSFGRLAGNTEFWMLDNRVILELCQSLNPDLLEDAFLDWIYADKLNRKPFLDKLQALRKLIMFGYEKLIVKPQPDPPENVPISSNYPSPIDLPADDLDYSYTTQHENELSPRSVAIFQDLPPRRPKKRPAENNGSGSTDDESSSPNKRKRLVRKNLSKAFDLVQDLIPVKNKKREKVAETSASRSSSSSSTGSGSSASSSVVEAEVNTLSIPGNSNSPNKSANNRTVSKKKKFKETGIDRFFRTNLSLIQKFLAEETYNPEFKKIWHGIFKEMNRKILANQIKNCERFISGNGIDLLFEIPVKFPDEIQLRQVSLEIIGCFAETKELRHFLYCDEIIEYVLKDLKNYSHFKNSATAGEILSYLLTEYDQDNWDLKTKRETITYEIRLAISHWDMKNDRNTFFNNFNDLLDLVRGTDSTANLCGLWSLAYFTSKDTNVKNRLDLVQTHISWLKNANIHKLLLDKVQNEEEDDEIAHYAEVILNNMGHKVTDN